jgi:hypothetical protein
VGELYVPTCYSSGRHEENHATGNKYNWVPQQDFDPFHFTLSRQGGLKLLFSVAHGAIHTVLGVQEVLRGSRGCKLTTINKKGRDTWDNSRYIPTTKYYPNPYSIRRPNVNKTKYNTL